LVTQEEKLAGELLKIRADIPVILWTGFSEQATEGRAKELGQRIYLKTHRAAEVG